MNAPLGFTLREFFGSDPRLWKVHFVVNISKTIGFNLECEKIYPLKISYNLLFIGDCLIFSLSNVTDESISTKFMGHI